MRNMTFLTMGEDLSRFITKTAIPDLTYDVKDQFTINKRRTIIGADNYYQFSIEFMDQDNAQLWRSFVEQYKLTKGGWFDDVKLTVSFFKLPDHPDQEDRGVHLVTFKECVIENLGGLSFSNEDETQILRFTVQFRQTDYSLKQ